jgi:hypothetical protein
MVVAEAEHELGDVRVVVGIGANGGPEVFLVPERPMPKSISAFPGIRGGTVLSAAV